MLTIRLSRTGKKAQPFFRIVVAEHARPVKAKFVELVGFYDPISKKTGVKKERIEHWIARGARPSETAAAIFKKEGLPGMEGFVAVPPRKKKSAPPVGSHAEAVATENK